MVFNDEPLLAVPTVNVSKSRLNAGSIFEGESVNTRIDRDITKSPDIGLINLTNWALSEEMYKIIGKFFMIMTDFVGYRWKQYGIGLI